jgi:hypothetical protein
LEVGKKGRAPVVALSQFNREASETGGGQLAHLRYSDRVGALASTVLSLALPREESGAAEVALKVVARKNRYGRKDAQVELIWDRARDGLCFDEEMSGVYAAGVLGGRPRGTV